VKKVLDRSAGLVTSSSGFLEIGSIVSCAAAGAEFGFALSWAVLLGGICLMLLVEMTGRFTAVTGETVVGAMRARFGFEVSVVPLSAIVVVSLLVLATELGGVAAALELATGISHRYWGPLAAFAVWLVLWTARFRFVETLVAALGLVAIAFVVAAVALRPDWGAVARGLLPSVPAHRFGRYAFLAAVILGASISPSLFYFYSSGAADDGWTRANLRANRAIAGAGIGFGTILSVAVVVVAALVLRPKGVVVDDIHELPAMLEEPLGRWGYRAFVAALGIACFGACAELALVAGYLVAQTLGWNFGQKERPHTNARFALVYTAAIIGAAVVVISGVDPVALTAVAMAIVALTLPLAVFPFLVLMNDERYLGESTNRLSGNVLVTAIVALALVLSMVTIPLQIAGG
jgi:Mn2+/Fe2+ NRAMP family transporter